MKVKKIASKALERLFMAVVGIILAPVIFLVSVAHSFVIAAFFLLYALIGDKSGAGEVLDELPFATKLK